MAKADDTKTENEVAPEEVDAKPKKKSNVPSLLPNAETYIKNGQNVLLIGKHGTGKTEAVRTIAEELGYKLKSFSCSTMDPFTDLVGVPVPRTRDDGREYLSMVRPIDIDDADIIFLDELNRARPEVRDAVLEMVNNKTINGEPLPNLKCCWAAINPPDDETEDYQVDDLDPALLDRFDAYIEFLPKPTVAYMAQSMPKPVAQALKAWWDAHNRSKRETYISPRRLHKIGLVYMSHRNKKALLQALPPGGSYDSTKLHRMLDQALSPKAQESSGLGDPIADGFDFSDPTTLQKDREKLAKFLEKHPTALETHKRTAHVLSSGVSAKYLVREWADVLESMSKPVLESMIDDFAQPKQSQCRLEFANLMSDKKYGKKWAKEHETLYNVLAGTSKNKLSQLPSLN